MVRVHDRGDRTNELDLLENVVPDLRVRFNDRELRLGEFPWIRKDVSR